MDVYAEQTRPLVRVYDEARSVGEGRWYGLDGRGLGRLLAALDSRLFRRQPTSRSSPTNRSVSCGGRDWSSPTPSQPWSRGTPQVTGRELDAIAEDVIRSAGAVPSLPRLSRLPGQHLCQCRQRHRPRDPERRPTARRGLVSIDCGAILDGGTATPRSPCRWARSAAAPGTVRRDPVCDVARCRACASRRAPDGYRGCRGRIVRCAAHEYGIVRDYVGHGIGTEYMVPDVPNVGPAGGGPTLVPGMVLAVEPMITLGSPENVTLPDAWTVVTMDGSLAAHWEQYSGGDEHRPLGAHRP